MNKNQRTDLLLCVEGLGNIVKIESDDGSILSSYEKGPDALGFILNRN